MSFAPTVVLYCSSGYHPELDALVEQFLAAGVKLVAVVGLDCERVECIIDELVVAGGCNPERLLLTSSHPGASVEDAVAFANSLSAEYAGEVQVVEI